MFFLTPHILDEPIEFQGDTTGTSFFSSKKTITNMGMPQQDCCHYLRNTRTRVDHTVHYQVWTIFRSNSFQQRRCMKTDITVDITELLSPYRVFQRKVSSFSYLFWIKSKIGIYLNSQFESCFKNINPISCVLMKNTNIF